MISTFLKRHLRTDRDFGHRPTTLAGSPSRSEDLGSHALAGAAVGAGVGAAIGGAAGYLDGLKNLDQQVTVKDETYFSQRPELVGAEYDDVDRRRRYNSFKEKWETKREDDDWDPTIRYHDDKPYQKPNFIREGSSLAGSIAVGALKGAAIGGAIGVAGSVASRLTGVTSGTLSAPLEGRGNFLMAGAGAGAVIGGVAGFVAGRAANQHTFTVTRTAPVYETQQIGWMPTENNASRIARDLDKGSGDYKLTYSELGDRYGEIPFEGQDAVHARVQVGEEAKEYRSTGLNPLTGTLTGVLAGSVFGLAAGAAAAVLTEIATS